MSMSGWQPAYAQATKFDNVRRIEHFDRLQGATWK